MKNLFDLSGKVAVVTGGAGLIGRSIIKGLASHGAMVYVAEIDMGRAESFRKSIHEEGLIVKVVSLDITDEDSIDKCLEKIISQDRKVDIWVNNAYPRTKDWGLK